MVVEWIPEHQRWVQAVFLVVRFLAMNGLPLRGDVENMELSSNEFGGGLYLNTFTDMLVPFDNDLREISKKLPNNAKYTSGQIQDEVIDVLQKVLKSKLRQKVLEANIYILMMDGSSERNWREIEVIVVRFVNKKGNIEEHDIGVEEANDRSAQGLPALMTKCLNDMDIPLDGAVSQCYDGASVMNGRRDGLQMLLSEKCGRNIVYVYCFCHPLHLVVCNIIDNVLFISEHYSLVSSLYNCIKLADVTVHYNCVKLKRLLETRCSGHRDSALAIDREIKESIDCLSICCSSGDVKSDHRVLARGLHAQITQPSFILLNKFLSEFLNQINIANFY